MNSVLQDLRFAFRMLRREPGFAAVAVLTLALGIAVNTGMFSIVNSVVLKPLRYQDPERLMVVWQTDPRKDERRLPTAPPTFRDIQAQAQSFEEMAGSYLWSFSITGHGEPLQVDGIKTTWNLLQFLGAKPMLGRSFVPEDETGNDGSVVMLSHKLWRTKFNADASIVGKTITLNGAPLEVVGVMPESFGFPPFWATEAQLWVPVRFEGPAAQSRRSLFLRAFGRLKPGVSVEQAQAELSTIAGRLAEQYPDSNANMGMFVERLHDRVVLNVKPALMALLGAVGMVLLIACANIANLLLVRGTARTREFAVRISLGASAGRLVRQLMIENTLLALIGGALGVLLAYAGLNVLATSGAANLPRLGEIEIDRTVLLVSLGLSMLTGMVFGLFPALQSRRTSVVSGLKEGANAATGASGGRARGILVASEVALAVVLLTGSGLLMRSLWNLLSVPLGFQTQNVLATTVSVAGSRYAGENQHLFFDEVMPRLQALPGVVSAGAINHQPIAGDLWRGPFSVVGITPGEDFPTASFKTATAGYFEALGIPLLRGRTFNASDTAESQPVVIVNQALVDKYFEGGEPEGKVIRWGSDPDDPELRVIGVVQTSHQGKLDAEPLPEVYFPYTQNPVGFFNKATIVLRTQGDPQALASAVKSTIWEVDRNLPIPAIETMEEVVSSAAVDQRFMTTLLGSFAGIALALAALGLYGVMSYSVVRRTREIGIRMALGSLRSGILTLILRQGMNYVLAGVAAGVLVSWWAVRMLESQLFQVKSGDPLTFALAPIALVIVAVVAILVPARRATQVEPTTALRYE